MKTTKAERIKAEVKAFCRIYGVEYTDAILHAVFTDSTCKMHYPATKLSYAERTAISAVVKTFIA